MSVPPLACTEVATTLRDRLDGLLEPKQAARLDAHVAICAACASASNEAARAKAARELTWPVAAPAPSLEHAIRTRYAATRRRPVRLLRLAASHAAAVAIGVCLAHLAAGRHPSSTAAPTYAVDAAAEDGPLAAAAAAARDAAPSADGIALLDDEPGARSSPPASQPRSVFLASPRRLR